MMRNVAVGEHLSPPMEAYFFPEIEFLQIVEEGGASVYVDLRRALNLGKQGKLPGAGATSFCAPLGRILARKAPCPKTASTPKKIPK